MITVLSAVLVAAALPSPGTAQEEAQEPVYLEVNCMRSTSADYAAVETEIWQPMHQEMVKQGKKAGWSLYWVLYGDRSVCDYYTVDSYRGVDQLNAERSLDAYFAAAHPGENWEEAMARTGASRVMVSSELWVWIDGVPPAGYQFALVNQMQADDGAAYVEFERQTWKPVHEALVKGEHSAGWGLYALVSPHGTAVPYNFGTVDFLNRLGPVPVEEAMKLAHPDKDAAAIYEKSLELRDHVMSETWVLIAGTDQGSR